MKRKRKRKPKENNPNKRVKRKTTTTHIPESDFHIALIRKLRERMKAGKLPKEMLIRGRFEGNYNNKNLMLFSKRVGYNIGDADITLTYPSYGKPTPKYVAMDIELKCNTGTIRNSQVKVLKKKEKDLSHFGCCVCCPNAESLNSTITKVLALISFYIKGPLSMLEKVDERI